MERTILIVPQPPTVSIDPEVAKSTKNKWRLTHFLKKYFWEGQKLEAKTKTEIPSDASWKSKIWIKYRRLIGLFIPFAFFQLIWWSLAIRWNYFKYFPEKYIMSITMIFGSMIAGMTSEGGGAVAFPVMTLALHIKPSIARDFSLMIQSCGMSAAAFSIFFMELRLEWHSLIYCSFGGSIGLIIGLEFVAPLLSPPVKKMLFVSVWFSFAVALFILNRKKKRRTFDTILDFCWWKALLLAGIGFVGGNFTAIAGSGVDICSFSILTLLFRVSEKVATPTSVVLMAINTCVGFYWRQFIITGVSQDAWEYLAVCVPIVTLGAPLGSLIASHFHRQILASMIYVLETIALISGFAIVKPGVALSCISVVVIIVGSLFFFGISQLGERIALREEPVTNSDGGHGAPTRQSTEVDSGPCPIRVGDKG